MQIISKIAIATLIIIIIFVVAYLIFVHYSAPKVNEAYAEAVVVKDLKSISPTAVINIVNVSPSSTTNNSWNITVSIVYNPTSPCPSLSIASYNYPKFNLGYVSENNYTRGCKIYGSANSSAYAINSPYIAIVKSYDQNNATIDSYVMQNGFNNTLVHAYFFGTLYPNATLNTTASMPDVWLINYSSTITKGRLYVVSFHNGTIAKTVYANES
ncbi:MAG: hypothetical protein M1559_01165 [Candidatus Marsarchaeota archaeon]|jgi:hypothetical protein|nr:hypothetical protein [Candidatus Marsarchaeota archaeon]MCL5434306.1 hypothetical protein [Candidatus Marsarchaeota archaeon]